MSRRRIRRIRRKHLLTGLALVVACVLKSSDLTAQSSADDEADSDPGPLVHWLPRGELFRPLAADPKEERSFMTYLRGDFATIADPAPGARTHIGAVGFGNGFALVRVGAPDEGDGVQVSVSGAVFSQFNLDRPSFDLINADYVLGFPLTLRIGTSSARMRVYHQSSHLGDEYVLSQDRERINLSFEAIELLFSQEIGPTRLYAGGENLFRRGPFTLARWLVHAGAEVRPEVFGRGRLFFATDLRLVDDRAWKHGLSMRAGLELARIPAATPLPSVVSLVAEFYDGLSPYGQFYREDIRYWGFGFQLDGF